MSEDQAPEAAEEGGVVPKKYREKYGKEKHCGDDVAVAMKEFTTDDKGKLIEDKLHKVAKDNKIDMEKYAGMNPGMQRMNIGNILRGKINRGEKVKVGQDTWDEDPSKHKPKKESKEAA